MSRSHATGWASDAPTPAQLKEFFAQIQSRRVTKTRLQEFLRECDFEGPALYPDPPPPPDPLTRQRVVSAIGKIDDTRVVRLLNYHYGLMDDDPREYSTDEIAQLFGVTKARIEQIERRARRQLRIYLGLGSRGYPSKTIIREALQRFA